MKPTSSLAGKDSHHSIITAFNPGADGTVMSFLYTSCSRCPGVLIKGTRAGLMHRQEVSGDLTAARKCAARQQ